MSSQLLTLNCIQNNFHQSLPLGNAAIEATVFFILYSGKVWPIESLANLANHLRFTKLEPSKVVVTTSDPLADLFIRQSLFHQMLEKNKFVKYSPRQTFPLYGIRSRNIMFT